MPKERFAANPDLFAEANKIAINRATGVRGFCPKCLEPVLGPLNGKGGQPRGLYGKYYYHSACYEAMNAQG